MLQYSTACCSTHNRYQPQQEALSHYLDTVEMCLIKQINRKASSFFDALSTLQRLHVDMTETLTSVCTMLCSLAPLSTALQRLVLCCNLVRCGATRVLPCDM